MAIFEFTDENPIPGDTQPPPQPPDDSIQISPALEQFILSQLGAPDEEKPIFLPGQDNTEFFAMVQDHESILSNLEDLLMDELQAQMEGLGYPREAGFQAFSYYGEEYGGWIDQFLNQANTDRDRFTSQLGRFRFNATEMEALKTEIKDGRIMGMDFYLGTPDGFQSMLQSAWNFWKTRIPGLQDYGSFAKPKAPRRGGGTRRPTAGEIRNMFDIDQLTDATRGIWRGLMLNEPENARSIAESYVEAIVATKAEKEIDFETFVKNRARGTARYNTIYENKPASLSEEQFLQPYHQAALQVTQGDEAANIAIGGAQFGATASAFGSRLRRTEAATASAPFVNNLQNRLHDLSGVLRG
jgi:hypothetical protein